MTERAQSPTLAEIEAEVEKAIRSKGASPEGERAILVAEQIITEVGDMLKAPGAVVGAPALLPPLRESVSTQRMGAFGTTITGTAAHKYAFGVRLTGRNIDVTSTFFLIPGQGNQKGNWLHALDSKSFGEPLPGDADFAAHVASKIVADLRLKALAKAAATNGVK